MGLGVRVGVDVGAGEPSLVGVPPASVGVEEVVGETGSLGVPRSSGGAGDGVGVEMGRDVWPGTGLTCVARWVQAAITNNISIGRRGTKERKLIIEAVLSSPLVTHLGNTQCYGDWMPSRGKKVQSVQGDRRGLYGSGLRRVSGSQRRPAFHYPRLVCRILHPFGRRDQWSRGNRPYLGAFEFISFPAILPLKRMGCFQILEHTGEIGILARGSTPHETFGQAARGMFSIMVELDAVEEREVRQVEAEGHDIEGLLVAWLNELIYLFDVEELVFKNFHIQEMDDTRLKALCYGEKLDMERHGFSIAPKAATYHMLEVRKEAEGSGMWLARVILDI